MSFQSVDVCFGWMGRGDEGIVYFHEGIVYFRGMIVYFREWMVYFPAF